MFLLPQGHIQIKTKLNSDLVAQRLAEQVEPRRAIPGVLRGAHKYFEGEINNRHFKINRVPDYKYAFTLVITGEIQTNGDQTIIDTLIHLDYALLTMLIIVSLILLFTFLCLPLQFYTMRNLSSFVQLLINALKLPLILYMVVLVSFNFKAYNILDYLNDLFAGK
jgi:hypothetical protein